jgi:DNA-binding NarL/FixJ family response regulator
MPSGRKSYRIVLADDHVLIRHGIKNIINQNPPFKVVGEVGNGDELLKLIKRDAPDMLILDITMPKISGIEVIGVVKKKYPEIKILMLTMYKTKGYFYSAMSAGADGYLLKDDSSDELLLAINKIREGKIYLSPMVADDFADDVLAAHRNREVSPFKGLTDREKQVLRLVVDGLTSRAIAEKLCLSPRTVDHHRARLLRKFKMRNTVDLVNFAVKNGFVSF